MAIYYDGVLISDGITIEGGTGGSDGGVANSVRTGVSLPGNTGSLNDVLTDLPTGYEDGDLFLIRPATLPSLVDSSILPFGFWTIGTVAGGFQWTFTGQHAQWNEHIIYFPTQIVFNAGANPEAAVTAYQASAININLEPGVDAGWENSWDRVYDGWGVEPTGTKPSNLSWNEVVSPVVHDSVTGATVRGQTLGSGFAHPEANAATELLFTLPDGDDRDVARDQFFIPKIRAVGMINDLASARVIDRVENVGANQLRVFFEGELTVLASDDVLDTSNIEIYTVEVDTIHTIEGGVYDNGILNITNDIVNIKPLWDGAQFVQTLTSTETDVASRVTLIEKRVISGNNETHRTLYGFPGSTALTLYSDTARANSVLTQNYTG